MKLSSSDLEHQAAQEKIPMSRVAMSPLSIVSNYASDQCVDIPEDKGLALQLVPELVDKKLFNNGNYNPNYILAGALYIPKDIIQIVNTHEAPGLKIPGVIKDYGNVFEQTEQSVDIEDPDVRKYVLRILRYFKYDPDEAMTTLREASFRIKNRARGIVKGTQSQNTVTKLQTWMANIEYSEGDSEEEVLQTRDINSSPSIERPREENENNVVPAINTQSFIKRTISKIFSTSSHARKTEKRLRDDITNSPFERDLIRQKKRKLNLKKSKSMTQLKKLGNEQVTVGLLSSVIADTEDNLKIIKKHKTLSLNCHKAINNKIKEFFKKFKTLSHKITYHKNIGDDPMNNSSKVYFSEEDKLNYSGIYPHLEGIPLDKPMKFEAVLNQDKLLIQYLTLPKIQVSNEFIVMPMRNLNFSQTKVNKSKRTLKNEKRNLNNLQTLNGSQCEIDPYGHRYPFIDQIEKRSNILPIFKLFQKRQNTEVFSASLSKETQQYHSRKIVRSCNNHERKRNSVDLLADTYVSVIDKPEDPKCCVEITGDGYKGKFNIGLDPIIDEVIYHSIQNLKETVKNCEEVHATPRTKKRTSLIGAIAGSVINVLRGKTSLSRKCSTPSDISSFKSEIETIVRNDQYSDIAKDPEILESDSHGSTHSQGNRSCLSDGLSRSSLNFSSKDLFTEEENELSNGKQRKSRSVKRGSSFVSDRNEHFHSSQESFEEREFVRRTFERVEPDLSERQSVTHDDPTIYQPSLIPTRESDRSEETQPVELFNTAEEELLRSHMSDSFQSAKVSIHDELPAVTPISKRQSSWGKETGGIYQEDERAFLERSSRSYNSQAGISEGRRSSFPPVSQSETARTTAKSEIIQPSDSSLDSLEETERSFQNHKSPNDSHEKKNSSARNSSVNEESAYLNGKNFVVNGHSSISDYRINPVSQSRETNKAGADEFLYSQDSFSSESDIRHPISMVSKTFQQPVRSTNEPNRLSEVKNKENGNATRKSVSNIEPKESTEISTNLKNDETVNERLNPKDQMNELIIPSENEQILFHGSKYTNNYVSPSIKKVTETSNGISIVIKTEIDEETDERNLSMLNRDEEEFILDSAKKHVSRVSPNNDINKSSKRWTKTDLNTESVENVDRILDQKNSENQETTINNGGNDSLYSSKETSTSISRHNPTEKRRSIDPMDRRSSKGSADVTNRSKRASVQSLRSSLRYSMPNKELKLNKKQSVYKRSFPEETLSYAQQERNSRSLMDVQLSNEVRSPAHETPTHSTKILPKQSLSDIELKKKFLQQKSSESAEYLECPWNRCRCNETTEGYHQQNPTTINHSSMLSIPYRDQKNSNFFERNGESLHFEQKTKGQVCYRGKSFCSCKQRNDIQKKQFAYQPNIPPEEQIFLSWNDRSTMTSHPQTEDFTQNTALDLEAPQFKQRETFLDPPHKKETGISINDYPERNSNSKLGKAHADSFVMTDPPVLNELGAQTVSHDKTQRESFTVTEKLIDNGTVLLETKSQIKPNIKESNFTASTSNENTPHQTLIEGSIRNENYSEKMTKTPVTEEKITSTGDRTKMCVCSENNDLLQRQRAWLDFFDEIKRKIVLETRSNEVQPSQINRPSMVELEDLSARIALENSTSPDRSLRSSQRNKNYDPPSLSSLKELDSASLSPGQPEISVNTEQLNNQNVLKDQISAVHTQTDKELLICTKPCRCEKKRKSYIRTSGEPLSTISEESLLSGNTSLQSSPQIRFSKKSLDPSIIRKSSINSYKEAPSRENRYSIHSKKSSVRSGEALSSTTEEPSLSRKTSVRSYRKVPSGLIDPSSPRKSTVQSVDGDSSPYRESRLARQSEMTPIQSSGEPPSSISQESLLPRETATQSFDDRFSRKSIDPSFFRNTLVRSSESPVFRNSRYSIFSRKASEKGPEKPLFIKPRDSYFNNESFTRGSRDSRYSIQPNKTSLRSSRRPLSRESDNLSYTKTPVRSSIEPSSRNSRYRNRATFVKSNKEPFTNKSMNPSFTEITIVKSPVEQVSSEYEDAFVTRKSPLTSSREASDRDSRYSVQPRMTLVRSTVVPFTRKSMKPIDNYGEEPSYMVSKEPSLSEKTTSQSFNESFSRKSIDPSFFRNTLVRSSESPGFRNSRYSISSRKASDKGPEKPVFMKSRDSYFNNESFTRGSRESRYSIQPKKTSLRSSRRPSYRQSKYLSFIRKTPTRSSTEPPTRSSKESRYSMQPKKTSVRSSRTLLSRESNNQFVTTKTSVRSSRETPSGESRYSMQPRKTSIRNSEVEFSRKSMKSIDPSYAKEISDRSYRESTSKESRYTVQPRESREPFTSESVDPSFTEITTVKRSVEKVSREYEDPSVTRKTSLKNSRESSSRDSRNSVQPRITSGRSTVVPFTRKSMTPIDRSFTREPSIRSHKEAPSKESRYSIQSIETSERRTGEQGSMKYLDPSFTNKATAVKNSVETFSRESSDTSITRKLSVRSREEHVSRTSEEPPLSRKTTVRSYREEPSRVSGYSLPYRKTSARSSRESLYEEPLLSKDIPFQSFDQPLPRKSIDPSYTRKISVQSFDEPISRKSSVNSRKTESFKENKFFKQPSVESFREPEHSERTDTSVLSRNSKLLPGKKSSRYIERDKSLRSTSKMPSFDYEQEPLSQPKSSFVQPTNSSKISVRSSATSKTSELLPNGETEKFSEQIDRNPSENSVISYESPVMSSKRAIHPSENDISVHFKGVNEHDEITPITEQSEIEDELLDTTVRDNVSYSRFTKKSVSRSRTVSFAEPDEPIPGRPFSQELYKEPETKNPPADTETPTISNPPSRRGSRFVERTSMKPSDYRESHSLRGSFPEDNRYEEVEDPRTYSRASGGYHKSSKSYQIGLMHNEINTPFLQPSTSWHPSTTEIASSVTALEIPHETYNQKYRHENTNYPNLSRPSLYKQDKKNFKISSSSKFNKSKINNSQYSSPHGINQAHDKKSDFSTGSGNTSKKNESTKLVSLEKNKTKNLKILNSDVSIKKKPANNRPKSAPLEDSNININSMLGINSDEGRLKENHLQIVNNGSKIIYEPWASSLNDRGFEFTRNNGFCPWYNQFTSVPDTTVDSDYELSSKKRQNHIKNPHIISPEILKPSFDLSQSSSELLPKLKLSPDSKINKSSYSDNKRVSHAKVSLTDKCSVPKKKIFTSNKKNRRQTEHTGGANRSYLNSETINDLIELEQVSNSSSLTSEEEGSKRKSVKWKV